jgi:hypothetical protein
MFPGYYGTAQINRRNCSIMAGSELRRSSNRLATPPSTTAHDETEFEPPSAGSETNIDAFSPAEEFEPNTKKRPVKKKPVVAKTK